MRENIKSIISSEIQYEDIFDRFVKKLSSTSCCDIKSLNQKKKFVGDLWEHFCCLYLENILGWTAKRLNECDDKLISSLHLRRQDVGIDIIAIDNLGNNIAIQCKYRCTCKKISWREIATFDALCMRTGPWNKCIVMTTSKNLQREGLKKPQDIFWGQTHFKSLQRHEWLKIAGFGDGQVCGGKNLNNDMRTARLNKFDTIV